MTPNNLLPRLPLVNVSLLLSEDGTYPGMVFGYDPEFKIVKVVWYKWGYHSPDRMLDWMTLDKFQQWPVFRQSDCIGCFKTLPPGFEIYEDEAKSL